MLGTILLVFSFVFALIAASDWFTLPRLNALAIAFAFFIAHLLFGGLL